MAAEYQLAPVDHDPFADAAPFASNGMLVDAQLPQPAGPPVPDEFGRNLEDPEEVKASIDLVSRLPRFSWARAVGHARGHDAIMCHNLPTAAGGKSILVVKERNQLRSPYAAFDPDKRNSSDLLAAVPWLATAGASAYELVPVDNDPFATATQAHE